jgi:hypothetical protein
MNRLELLISLNNKYRVNTCNDSEICRMITAKHDVFDFILERTPAIDAAYNDRNGSWFKSHRIDIVSNLPIEILVDAYNGDAVEIYGFDSLTLHHLTDDELIQLKLLTS